MTFLKCIFCEESFIHELFSFGGLECCLASVHEAWPLEVGCVVRVHYRHGLSRVRLVVLRRVEGGGRADQIESLLAVFSELAMHCNMLGFLVRLRKLEESSRIIFLFHVSIVIEHL